MSQVGICGHCGRKAEEHIPSSGMCITPNGDTYYQPKDDKPYTSNEPKFVFSGWRSPGETEKVVVPEGMLAAATAAQGRCVCPTKNIVEAALLWLSENPIVPSNEWMDEQIVSAHPTLTSSTFTTRCIAEWQRRMFLAPEPEVPEEIKDLVDSFNLPIYKEGLKKAFRLGQQSKSTTRR